MEQTKPVHPCSHISRYFQSYIDGELNSREINLVNTHVLQCSNCKKDFQKLQRFHKKIVKKLSKISLADDFVAEVISRISQSQSTQESASQSFEIGGYKILEKIGQGSMGSVFKAIQLSLRRVVALKILSAKYVTNTSYIKRFQREARAAASLQHPNIIQVYDVGQETNIYYFSMEYVEGKTVAEILEEDEKIELNKALDMVIQTARALAHAESLQIVHRDIKPDNIIIDQYGVARLADLGMAKKMIEIDGELSDSEQVFKTQIGTIMGTPEYMSPEQATNSKDVNHQADIYSLGATFYHMVVGRPPFHGETVMETLSNVLHERLKFEGVDEVPLKIKRIIQKMMAKDLGDRYPNGEALLRALMEVRNRTTSGFLQVDSTFLPAQAGDTTSLQTAQTTTLLGKLRKKKKGLPPTYFAYGALGLLALGLVYFLFSSGDSGKTQFQKALKYSLAHPEKKKALAKKFWAIYSRYPHSSWGIKALNEWQFIFFAEIFKKTAQKKFYSAYHQCEVEREKTKNPSWKKKLARIKTILKNEMNLFFQRKKQELFRVLSLKKAREIQDEIKSFASPSQCREAKDIVQQRLPELK